MQWKDLCEAGISVNTPTKFSQNKTMNTEIIDKVCAFLKVQPGDIMEWVNESDQKEREIQAKIDALQKQLADVRASKSNYITNAPKAPNFRVL